VGGKKGEMFFKTKGGGGGGESLKAQDIFISVKLGCDIVVLYTAPHSDGS